LIDPDLVASRPKPTCRDVRSKSAAGTVYADRRLCVTVEDRQSTLTKIKALQMSDMDFLPRTGAAS
jgi:hypothetical protein